MLGIAADREITTAMLKDELGFYLFDLVGGSKAVALREEVRIGDRVLHSVVTPLTDEDGAPIGAVVVLRDLGETRDLARRRAEFAQLMSHELRTPLTSVAGALDIVLAGYAGELYRQAAALHRDGAPRRDPDERARRPAAGSGAGPDRVDHGVAVADAPRSPDPRHRRSLSRQRPQQGRPGHRDRASGEALGILGDAERLAQVLGNLLTNSIKFAPQHGSIEVALFGPPLVPDAVGVSVFNDGSPIAPEDRERIFEPFSASGRHVGGSGMGLSISRSIIEAHGGRMWLETTERGTKFVFTLPCKPAAIEVASPLGAPAPAVRKRREAARVLVVDDDLNRALLLKGLLLADGDLVEVVEDADSALAQARALPPVAAVVAGSVPDALALVAILEHDPATRKVAKLALVEPGVAAAFASAGADEVLELPMQPQALRAACHRLIDSDRRAAQRVLVVDDDAGIRAICREVLEQAGYVVRDVGSADLALAEARRFRPDLVLLDVMMPLADGFRTAERLRTDPTTSLTPIIFLSARGDVADKVRAFRSGAEDYMVKPFDGAELAARVGKALARHARELGASPTTQLPGGDAIEAEIERRLAARDRAAVACYLDLDNLKAFNDYYGYAKADAVIRQTGGLIRDVIASLGGPGDFIGHIAGDDFVYVARADTVDAISRAICERFDRMIPLYYDRDDRARGHIETKDRFGVQRSFPIMSVSIAAITLDRVGSFAELAALAAVGKQAAKAIPGSSYLRDGQPVATPSAVETA
ncbi:MAG: response regulator [Kofleriaceae bacterium]